jgi:hypothetical protein
MSAILGLVVFGANNVVTAQNMTTILNFYDRHGHF